MKLGGVAAVGGSLLGYAGAAAIQEQVIHVPLMPPGDPVPPGLQQSTREYIDSHYTAKPEVFVSSPRKDAAASSPAARRKMEGGSPRSRRGSLLPPGGEFGERRGSLVQVCKERRDGSRRRLGGGSSGKEKENGSRETEDGSRKEKVRRERPRHLPCRAERAKAL